MALFFFVFAQETHQESENLLLNGWLTVVRLQEKKGNGKIFIRDLTSGTKVVCVYLQDLLVKLQALTLNEVVSRGRDLIRQVPQSSKCKIQSGVNHPHHGLLLHNGQQLLRDRRHQKKNR